MPWYVRSLDRSSSLELHPHFDRPSLPSGPVIPPGAGTAVPVRSDLSSWHLARHEPLGQRPCSCCDGHFAVADESLGTRGSRNRQVPLPAPRRRTAAETPYPRVAGQSALRPQMPCRGIRAGLAPNPFQGSRAAVDTAGSRLKQQSVSRPAGGRFMAEHKVAEHGGVLVRFVRTGGAGTQGRGAHSARVAIANVERTERLPGCRIVRGCRSDASRGRP
jgi:hypothetical protein